MKTSIFKTIRQQTNQTNASIVRETTGDKLRLKLYSTLRKDFEETTNEQLGNVVDALLNVSAAKALEMCLSEVKELNDDSPEAKESREAIIQSVVLSGQYIKKTVNDQLKPVFDNLHARVAETMTTIVGEAMVQAVMNKPFKSLPASEE